MNKVSILMAQNSAVTCESHWHPALLYGESELIQIFVCKEEKIQ